MKALPVRVERDWGSINITLKPFLTDWEAARSVFVSSMLREFIDLHESVGPRDFNFSHSSNLGEAWCAYQMFGGLSRIVLRPDSLEFDFPSLRAPDYQVVGEIVRKGTRTLLSALNYNDSLALGLASHRHLAVIDGDAKGHIAQFASKALADAVRNDATLRNRPSARLVLQSDDGERTLRRSLEQSELVENGLFVSTQVFNSAFKITKFDNEIQWLVEKYKFADHAFGISYSTDK